MRQGAALKLEGGGGGAGVGQVLVEVVGHAEEMVHHEAVEGWADEAGFGDGEGGGVGGGAGGEEVGPGATVGGGGQVEEDVAAHRGLGAGGEEGHGLAVAEVLNPVVAAVVGREHGDGLDGVTPGGRGGDVGDEGEDFVGRGGDGSGDGGGVVDGEGEAVDVGEGDDRLR